MHIIKVDDARMVDEKKLKDIISKSGLIYKDFTKCEKDKNYLVFGSFSVVETFLKTYRE